MITILKRLHLFGTWRRIAFLFVNHIFKGTKLFEIKRKLLISTGCEIGKNTKIVAPITFYGQLIIGNNCWIGKNLRVNGNGIVTIGDNCDIGPEVTFQTGGHEIGDSIRRAGKGLNFCQTVGNGCWLGGGSTILNNTSIGDGSIIAGCACVTKDVPANTLVGGVPARKIRDLDDEHI